jgi:ribosomal protein S25
MLVDTMGGKKKLSLKQLERRQGSAGQRQRTKQRRTVKPAERKSMRIISPEINDESVVKELKRMKVLTPYTVGSRFDLRLSVAKDFLENLHQRGIIEYVSGGRNTKIYKPAS